MNFTRPKLLLSLLLLAVVGLLASGNIYAQDPSVTGINVRPNAQSGHYPILLDDSHQGLNSVDVILTNLEATSATGDLVVNLSISWPGQVGGPLVLTQTMTNYTFNASGVHTINYNGAWLAANGFTFDRRIIYTLTASFTFSGTDNGAGNNTLATPRMVAPAFNKAKITINYHDGVTADFDNFSYMGQYLTYSGLLGDLEVSVASGTFSTTHTDPSSSTMSIDGSYFTSDDNYQIYIHGMKNYPQNTIIRDFARDRGLGDFWMWRFRNINVDIKYLTLTLEATAAYNEGGQILSLENTSTDDYWYNLEGNVFNGYAVPELASNVFAAIYCSGDYVHHFHFMNNKVYGGWASVYMDADADPTPVGADIVVANNEFWNFTNSGVVMIRPAVTTPADYNGGVFQSNVFSSTAFNGNAISVSNLSIITNNTFTLTGTGSEYAVGVTHTPTYYPEVTISNNTFTGSQYGAIAVTNSRRSIINDNSITIANSGVMPAIYINGGGSDLITNYTHIQNNNINMSVEGSGLTIVSGNYHKVYYNTINLVSAASANGKYAVSANNSRGIIASNYITTTFADGILVDGLDENIFYNTVIISGAANTNAALSISDAATSPNGKVVAKRNMLANTSTGAASYSIYITLAFASQAFLDENNYYAAGGNFGLLTGIAANMATWQAMTQILPGGLLTNDVGSTIAPAAMITRDGGQVFTYELFDNDVDSTNAGPYVGIFFDTPLFPVEDPLHAEFEMNDYFGNQRIGYYAGYTNVHPVASIVTEPSDIFSCKGEDWQLQCVANVTLNAHAYYQWTKDGVVLDGENNASLLLPDLNWEDAGKYQCIVSGQGGTAPVMSYEVIVVVIGKTSITRQPADQMGTANGTVVFEVEAHTQGFPPYDPDFPSEIYNPKFQWYQVINGVGVPLEDNSDYEYNNIAGAKSSILSIANLNTDAWTQPIEVYCEVLGYCDYHYDLLSNKVWEWTRTSNVKVLAPPSLTIDTQPADLTICEGQEATFKVVATITGDAEATYKWKKDNVYLANGGNISGANTEELKIANLVSADAGVYMVEITFLGDIINSEDANLTIDTKPAITSEPSATITVETGKPLELVVAAEGSGTIQYQWTKDTQDIPSANSATFTVAAAQATDAGTYTCKVKNECGEVETQDIAVTVTIKEVPNKVDDAVAGGFVLLNNVPNPFTEETIISFLAPVATNVRLTVSDLFGRQVANYNILANEGLNTFDLNASNARLISGVYNYTIEANGVKLTKQFVVNK